MISRERIHTISFGDQFITAANETLRDMDLGDKVTAYIDETEDTVINVKFKFHDCEKEILSDEMKSKLMTDTFHKLEHVRE